MLHVCACKGKDKKLVDKQWKEKMQKGIKQISMIGMVGKEARKLANKQKVKQARKQTNGGFCEGQM